MSLFKKVRPNLYSRPCVVVLAQVKNLRNCIKKHTILYSDKELKKINSLLDKLEKLL